MPNMKLNDLHYSDLSDFIYVVYIHNDGSVMYEVLKDRVFGQTGLYNKKEFDLFLRYREDVEELRDEESSV